VILDISVDNVKVTLYEAVKLCRRCLNRCKPDDPSKPCNCICGSDIEITTADSDGYLQVKMEDLKREYFRKLEPCGKSSTCTMYRPRSPERNFSIS
jgi:hypothetical protein